MEQWRGRLEAEGIRWNPLPYHKQPSLPATLYDIVAGARAASRLRLRMFTLEDLEDLCVIASDPEVMRFIGRGLPLTREETPLLAPPGNRLLAARVQRLLAQLAQPAELRLRRLVDLRHRR